MHGCKSCSEKHKGLLFGAARNEMPPLFCGWRDPSPFLVSRQTFGSALLCWNGISVLNSPCGCWFSQLLCAQTESGKTTKTHAPPNSLWLHLLSISLVSLNNTLLFVFTTPDFYPVKMFLKKNLCKVWVSRALESSLNYSSMKHVTCGAQSSFHNSLLAFLINCLAHRLLLSVSDYLQVSMLLFSNRILCF